MPRTAGHMPAKLALSAYELFAEHGFGEVTLDEIASHAGVTKGSLYCHYRSRHDLVLAACSHYYRTYQRKVHGELARLTDPVARLRRVVELSVWSCIIDARSRVFTTGIFALSMQDEQVRAGWAQFYDSVREMYVGLVEAVETAGQRTGGDPRQAVDLMLAAIEGVKLRASFEPHIAADNEQRAIAEGLLSILGVGRQRPERRRRQRNGPRKRSSTVEEQA